MERRFAAGGLRHQKNYPQAFSGSAPAKRPVKDFGMYGSDAINWSSTRWSD